jgi:HK97 family phage major capsid protein
MTQSTAQWRSEASADELSARAAEIRGEYAELVKDHPDRAADTFRTAHRQLMEEVEDIDVNMTLRGMEALPEALRGKVKGGDNGTVGDTRETRSIGEQVIGDEEFTKWCKRAAQKGTMIGESPSVELRALVAESDANGSSSLLPVGQPYLVDQRRRRLFIRDLISVQQTTLSAIPYVRELNSAANALSASTVAEGATKPEATIQLTPDIAPVQVIATTIPITTQILEDGVTLVGYINGRLVYMLKIREELEILSGNGITPDLKGILTYSDVQAQAFTADVLTTIGNAIAKVELVDGFADGVAMNPADYWAMATHRVAGGSNAAGGGVFDAASFTQAPANFVWGLPAVRTNGITLGTALVGNYAMGATLFDRSQSGVRVFEQHGEFAKENKVLLRAEERVALAVNRADFFVNCDLTA